MKLWLASLVLVAVGLVGITAALYGLAWLLFLHGEKVWTLVVAAMFVGGAVFLVVVVHDHIADRAP